MAALFASAASSAYISSPSEKSTVTPLEGSLAQASISVSEDGDSRRPLVTSITRAPTGTADEDYSDENDAVRKPDEDNVGERCELESFTQCSRSHLWKLMMSFYDRKGPESWSQGIVPHFITCNAFIGRSYAKVLLGFLRDCMNKKSKIALDFNEPMYIIELGTGSGKFCYFMLKALQEMKDVCDFPIAKIVYVMTDFTENNFKFWRDHPSLKPYFESGILDAGIFDAVNDRTITLWRSGKVLGPGVSKNPICVVANYLFDTLYHDIFQVDEGQLKEGLISVGSKRREEPDPLEPDIIKRLDNRFQYTPITPDYYTDEEGDEVHFRRILRWYHEHFRADPSGGSFLLPIGALRALRRLAAFSSSGSALVISGDKGNNNPEHFSGIMDPHIAVHGSFSLMVNYHAIGMWFTSRGGFTLHNPQEEASLKVSCFVLTADPVIAAENQGEKEADAWLGDAITDKDNERSSAFPHLRVAFSDAVDLFGPNDFFVLQKSLKEDAPNPPLKAVVALLKLGDWDPDVFFKFRDVILNQVPNCGAKLRNDLCRGIPRVWSNYYMLDTDKDIAFEIGRFYYGIREYAEALKYYIESNRSVGEHHVTYHNQGLCHYSEGRLETALEFFLKSISLNSDYEKAKSWIEKVQKELATRVLVPNVVGEKVDGDGDGAGDIAVSSASVPVPPAAVVESIDGGGGGGVNLNVSPPAVPTNEEDAAATTTTTGTAEDGSVVVDSVTVATATVVDQSQT
eukprot:gene6099-12343_t